MPKGRTKGRPLSKETINSLQAGRGIAALLVVLWHCLVAARSFGAARFLPFPALDFGYLGVDFFFVLSGFIIYHSTVGRGRTIKDYAIARFRRVYLPYWPIGIAVALLYVVFPTMSAGTREWGWLPTLTLAPVDSQTALSVAWTLQHEVLFYLIFGLFFFARMLPLGLTVWAAAILFIGDCAVFETINLEFYFGIAAAILYRRNLAHPLFFLSAPAFLLLWIATGGGEEHRLWIGTMFACIVAPLAQLERQGRVSVPAPFLLLGAASYSIYLVHNPLISAVARLLSGPWPIMLGGLAAALLAGFAYHFAVEIRVVRKRNNPEVHARA